MTLEYPICVKFTHKMWWEQDNVNKRICWGQELTLSQSAGLSDLSVVQQADAARQRPERYHTCVVFNLTAGIALQN